MLGEVRAWIRVEQGHVTCDRPGERRRAVCLNFQRIISGPASDMLAPLHIAVPSWCRQASFACRTGQQRHGDGGRPHLQWKDAPLLAWADHRLDSSEENRRRATLQHNTQKCFGGPIAPILMQKCTKTPEGCHSPPSSSNHFWSETDTDDERSDDWPSVGVLFRISL